MYCIQRYLSTGASGKHAGEEEEAAPPAGLGSGSDTRYLAKEDSLPSERYFPGHVKRKKTCRFDPGHGAQPELIENK